MSELSFKEQLLGVLKGHPEAEIVNLFNYYSHLKTEKKKINGNWTNEQKNPWVNKYGVQDLAEAFLKVKNEGLVLDGKHVTLQSTGISFDYVAYKNKMLLAYPETKLSIGLVYEGDDYKFDEKDGKVLFHYSHKDPFKTDETKIIGAYLVIKNKRGEFLTTLTKADIAKHRDVAKTDYIWRAWFPEMVLKTVIKKGCKYHFDDLFEGINDIDNENIDLEQVTTDKSDPIEALIETATTVDQLTAIYNENKHNLTPEHIKMLTARKEGILQNANS